MFIFLMKCQEGSWNTSSLVPMNVEDKLIPVGLYMCE